MLVGLKKGWPAPYRRTVREAIKNKAGRQIGFTVKKTLVFNPRETVEITDPEELKAIKSALDKGVLEEMVPKERVELKGPTVPVEVPSTVPPEPAEVSAVTDAFAGVDDDTPLNDDIEEKSNESPRHHRKR